MAFSLGFQPKLFLPSFFTVSTKGWTIPCLNFGLTALSRRSKQQNFTNTRVVGVVERMQDFCTLNEMGRNEQQMFNFKAQYCTFAQSFYDARTILRDTSQEPKINFYEV
jgi:hypothetical protein